MPKGSFITFEGIDGAGKTAQIDNLKSTLTNQGYPVVTTREPGGTQIGDDIRQLLLSSDYYDMSSETEALLYAASRAQLVKDVIQPKLEEGYIVLCDRFIDSSVAYQGGGGQLGLNNVLALNRLVTERVVPDLTILIDIPCELAIKRLEGEMDRIEDKGIYYQIDVRSAFLSLSQENPDRIKLIDGTKSFDEVTSEVYFWVNKLLEGGL